MAYRRSITARVTLLTRRFNPSFSHVLHNDNDDTKSHPMNPSPSQLLAPKTSLYGLNCTNLRSGSLFQDKCSSFFAHPAGLGSSFSRYMSNTPETWSSHIDNTGFVTELIPEKIVESVVASQGPALSEVAVATADSSFLVGSVQHLVDAIHSFTGLEWWASIVLTTVLIRGVTVPLLISQLKATSKLNLLRPHLEQLKREMNQKANDPDAVAEGRRRMKTLFDEYDVSPFTPLKGLLIQGPIFISFFLAIRNMAEKVPSFETGGALWFTDLTTPDSLYILPILTSLTFWITVECNMQEGMEGNPVAGTMKYFSRILAVVAVPVMAGFPKALFCYWLTSNLFSIGYGLVIRVPNVKKFLNLPEFPSSQPEFPSFSALEKFSAATPEEEEPSFPLEPSNITAKRISRSSILSQRMRILEKQLKNKKNRK